jgi:hypothetical protein
MVKTPEQAVAMVKAICALPGNRTAIGRQQRQIRSSGLPEAVIDHDTAFLYGWLMEVFSFQGISNDNAMAYLAAHGNAEWTAIDKALPSEPPECEKLRDFAAFRACGYRKIAATCNVPALLASCAVPKLPLRKGDLNQLAVSLYLFIRDVCRGDLVRFIDGQLAANWLEHRENPVSESRKALIAALKPVFGIGPKLISMGLASILLAGGRVRRHWVEVGRSMIVVDTLVHNFLHRSGILEAFGMSHAYGPACYGRRGCEVVLRQCESACKIDPLGGVIGVQF